MPRAWTTYPTSGVRAGGGGTPTVTGANVAEVLAGLAAYTGAGLAIATVSGQAPRLMAYDATDDAWYGTDGGDGSELTPYWTASTGEDGIDALPAATSGAYGIIGKGSGTPQAQRRLTLIADGALSTGATAASVGALLPGPIREWVSPTLHALGTPATCYIMDRATGSWSASSPSGSQFNWNSTVANRIAVLSGTAASNTVSIGTRSTSATLAILARRITLANAAAAGSSAFIRTQSSSDTGQFCGIAAGGSTGSATNYSAWNGSAALVDTGIAIATEKSLEALLTLSSNALAVRVNGAASATYSGTSVVTTASTNGAEVVATVQSVASRWSFRTFYAMEW